MHLHYFDKLLISAYSSLRPCSDFVIPHIFYTRSPRDLEYLILYQINYNIFYIQFYHTNINYNMKYISIYERVSP